MRLATFCAALAVAAVSLSALGADYNRFGKGPTTLGLTPPGYSSSVGGAYVYRAPAPVVAKAPIVATPPVVAQAPATDGRRAFSAEPSTATAAPAAPAATTVTAREYNRFGKGPTTLGLTPPGVR